MNNKNIVSLTEAINNIIEDFADTRDFSIYNITKELRERVRNGLKIKNLYKIYHNDVKTEFNDILQNLSSGYIVDVVNNGTYNVFTISRVCPAPRKTTTNPVLLAPTNALASIISKTLNKNQSGAGTKQPTTSKGNQTGNNNALASIIANTLNKNTSGAVSKQKNTSTRNQPSKTHIPLYTHRIITYITNKKNKRQSYTLKQVQSAIKRGKHSTGLRVSQIKMIIDNLDI